MDFLFAERDVLLTVLLKQMWSSVRTNEMGVRTSDPYCQVNHLSLVKLTRVLVKLFLSVGIKFLNALKFLDEYSHMIYAFSVLYAL